MIHHLNRFFFQLLEDVSPFVGSLIPPVLDFWWIPSMDSPDSPLVLHQLTYWQPAFQPSLFDPCPCTDTSTRVFQKLDKMLLPVGIESGSLIASDSKSNTLLSELVRHVLLRRSINFCSCATWCLVGFNRAWLYKQPKISVLQGNAKLVQNGECWIWNQRLWEAQVLFPLG